MNDRNQISKNSSPSCLLYICRKILAVKNLQSSFTFEVSGSIMKREKTKYPWDLQYHLQVTIIPR